MSAADIICGGILGLISYGLVGLGAGAFAAQLVEDAVRRKLNRITTWDEDRQVGVVAGVAWPLLAPALLVLGAWKLGGMIRSEFSGAARLVLAVARAEPKRELPPARVVTRE